MQVSSLRRFLVLSIVLGMFSFTAKTFAQIADKPVSENQVTFGKAEVYKFRVGVEVTAKNGGCRNFFAMVAVPLICPEQQVTVIKEEISPRSAKVTYRDLAGVRQMLVKIPTLGNKDKARVLVTFEVRTSPIIKPSNTENLKRPAKATKANRIFLGSSPFIETRNRRIRALSKEILKDMDEATDWERAEAIYDYVQQNIKYEEGDDKRCGFMHENRSF